MASTEQTVTVELPRSVVERIGDRVVRTEFDSEGEYVAYVLEEVLDHVEREAGNDDFDSADEDEVKDRLESLGYLTE